MALMLLTRKRPSLLAALILILLWLILIYGGMMVFERFQSYQSVSSQAEHQKILTQQLGQLDPVISSWYERAAKTESAEDWSAVQAVCILEDIPAQPSDAYCVPITFATLASLRQAAQNGQADLAWIQVEQAEGFILVAQRQPPGALQLMALHAATLNELTAPLDTQLGRWEIRQGQNRVLSAVGSITGTAEYIVQPISQSHWQLAFSGQTVVVPDYYRLAVVPLLIIVTLVWWLMLSDKPAKRSKLNYKSKLLKTAPEMIDSVEPSILVVRERFEQTNTPEVSETVYPEDVFDSLPTEPTEIVEDVAMDLPETPEDIVVESHLFGAYDIRGNVETVLTPKVATKIAGAFANLALRKNIRRIVVGRDARHSSKALSDAFIHGLIEGGVDVIDLGELPTAMLWFASKALETRSGVMITAGHQPSTDNGFKFILDEQFLSTTDIQTLRVDLNDTALQLRKGTLTQHQIADDYLKALMGNIVLNGKLSVVVDGRYGVAGHILGQALNLLGCEVVEINNVTTQTVSSQQADTCDPAALQDLIQAVKSSHAALGFAISGDGSRLAVVSGDGTIIWTDRLLILFAQAILRLQPSARIIFDVKSSGILTNRILQAGGKPTMSAVGYTTIHHTLKRTGAQLAGEMSGHFFFADRWNGFDDGVYAACRLVELITNDEQMRDATTILTHLPTRVITPEIRIALDDASAREFIQTFIEEADFENGQLTLIDGIRIDFANGWGLVRATNTTSGLSMRFEAATDADLLQIQQLFKAKILKIKPSLRLPF